MNLKCAWLFILLFMVACGDEEGFKGSSFTLVYEGGKVKNFEITEARYSPILKRFVLMSKNELELFNITLRVDELDQFTTGDFVSTCNLEIQYIDPSGTYTNFIGQDPVSLSVTEIDKSEGAYQIAGSKQNLTLPSFTSAGKSVTFKEVSFDASFKIDPTDDLDFLSFEIDNEPYIFYGKNINGFLDPFNFPNPRPEDTELIISANINNQVTNNFLGEEGITLKLLSPTYPPIPETVNGYSNGVRITYVQSEVPNCDSSIEIYKNGYNLDENFEKGMVQITSVEDQGSDYIISGTFSGVATETTEDKALTFSNGKFRITAAKL